MSWRWAPAAHAAAAAASAFATFIRARPPNVAGTGACTEGHRPRPVAEHDQLAFRRLLEDKRRVAARAWPSTRS